MIEIGLQQFALDHDKHLRKRRVGLVTHMAAVAPDFTHALDVLLGHGVNITALFGPEHGLDGAGADATDGPAMRSRTDSVAWPPKRQKAGRLDSLPDLCR